MRRSSTRTAWVQRSASSSERLIRAKAAAGQPLRMELREIARELRPRELRERGIARGTGKLAQVAQVRLARVSRPCREVRFERAELGVQGFSLAHCL